jgi:hypothetical protein
MKATEEFFVDIAAQICRGGGHGGPAMIWKSMCLSWDASVTVT